MVAQTQNICNKHASMTSAPNSLGLCMYSLNQGHLHHVSLGAKLRVKIGGRDFVRVWGNVNTRPVNNINTMYGKKSIGLVYVVELRVHSQADYPIEYIGLHKVA